MPDSFGNFRDLIETDLVAQAQQLATTLLDRSTPRCLLHGDLHHYNLLQRASGEWAMIDPEGIAGDPGSEIARWMHNPPDITEREDVLDIAAQRCRIWADVTGIDADDLASWALVVLPVYAVFFLFHIVGGKYVAA